MRKVAKRCQGDVSLGTSSCFCQDYLGAKRNVPLARRHPIDLFCGLKDKP